MGVLGPRTFRRALALQQLCAAEGTLSEMRA
jgi:hypothetical protein